LTITVQDVNDNAPIFSQPDYVGYVVEHEKAGTVVATVTATDKDEVIIYVTELVSSQT